MQKYKVKITDVTFEVIDNETDNSNLYVNGYVDGQEDV